eukprot:NODE_92_length_21718_cov_0.361950.p2 type:complete len:1074 gc:universal NODE_92_length_21718_cov_0.361950:17492-20713(+)
MSHLLPEVQPRIINDNQRSLIHCNSKRSFFAKELIISKPEKAGEDAWIVERLLDYDANKYLVLWHGNEQSWQPYQDLFDCPDLVYQFWQEQKKINISQPSEVRHQLKEMQMYAQDNSTETDEANSDEEPFAPGKTGSRSSDESGVQKTAHDLKRPAYDEPSSLSDDYDDLSELSAISYHNRKRKKAKRAEENPEYLVQEILTWQEEPDGTRSFACKLEDTSYHDLTWIPESELQVVSAAKYRNFMKARFVDPPIPVEDTFDPAYLKVHKVMIVEEDELLDNTSVKFYMIKWENLSYLYKTFETDIESLPNFQNALDRYNLSLECAKEMFKRPPKKRSYSKITAQPDFIPSHLILKTHQLDGLNRILYNWSIHKSMILADEMGLGKTIQTIVFISYLYFKYRLAPFIVIVPNSTLDNWEREFQKWAPFLSVLLFAGDVEDRESVKSYEAFFQGNLRFHVLITTYSTVRLDTLFIKKCGPFACLIVDESHNLKNERSILYNCVGQLQVDFTLFLTGTPVQNKIRELFALLNFLDPKEFGNINDLEQEYSNLHGQLVIDLLNKLRPYILRRTVKHIASELPLKKEVVIKCGMTKLQKELYKDVISKNAALLVALDQSTKGTRTDVWMQLMRISMHPYAVDADIEPRDLSSAEELRLLINSSGKYTILIQIMDKLYETNKKDPGTGRVIVFAQHKRSLDILQDILFKKQYPCFRMDGDTNRLERQSMFDAFNNDQESFAFIMTTRCGSEGINLTAASTVILMDMDFNPTVDKQAIGRCYRIGQVNRVLAIKLVTTNTVDERRLVIATKKSTLNRLLVKPLDSAEDLNSTDIDAMIKHGSKQMFENVEDDAHIKLTDEELRECLDKSNIEATEELINDEEDAFNTITPVQAIKLDIEVKESEQMKEKLDSGDNEFWNDLIVKKLKEEEEKRAKEMLGRGMRKKKNHLQNHLIDETENTKDGDFEYFSDYDDEDDELKDIVEEEKMVGDLLNQNKMDTDKNINKLLNGIQEHRNCLRDKGLLRPEKSNVLCWLCNDFYHHLMSCPVIRDVKQLRYKLVEFENNPGLKMMIERVLMIAMS